MDADPVRLVVSPDDGRLAAEVLARAFHADPPVVHFIPDPVRRAAVMPEFFERFVRHGQLFGEVHGPAARLEAIAIWLPPGRTDVTPERARRSGLDTLVDVFDGESFARLSAFLAQTADLHQRAMPGPHWYLAFIGVDPAAQGRGLGGALIAPGLARARREGTACYLETFQARTVPFYLRHGFTIVAEGRLPGSDLAFWTMRRDPSVEGGRSDGEAGPPSS
jgi:ribosomal protein S18 acetylase RimI-like enzyme